MSLGFSSKLKSFFKGGILTLTSDRLSGCRIMIRARSKPASARGIYPEPGKHSALLPQALWLARLLPHGFGQTQSSDLLCVSTKQTRPHMQALWPKQHCLLLELACACAELHGDGLHCSRTRCPANLRPATAPLGFPLLPPPQSPLLKPSTPLFVP